MREVEQLPQRPLERIIMGATLPRMERDDRAEQAWYPLTESLELQVP